MSEVHPPPLLRGTAESLGSPVYASTAIATSHEAVRADIGVGEIGITATAAAEANSVWHAAGICVRKFPITLNRLIEAQ